MKSLLYILFFCCTAATIAAQTPPAQYLKAYGDASGHEEARQVIQLNDGTIMAIGYTNSKIGTGPDDWSKGGKDGLVVNIDPADGSVVVDPTTNKIKAWTYGGALDDEFHAAKSVVERDGNTYIYIVGETKSFVQANVYLSDMWVLKITTDGDVVWSINIGKPDATGFNNGWNDAATGLDIVPGAMGGIVVCGYSKREFESSALVARITLDGTVNFLYSYQLPSSSPCPQSVNMEAQNIVYDNKRGFVLNMNIPGLPDMGVGNECNSQNMTLMRLDLNGEVDWVKDYPQTGSDYVKSAKDLFYHKDRKTVYTSGGYGLNSWASQDQDPFVLAINPVHRRRWYEYRLVAIDDAGLEMSSIIVKTKSLDQGIRDTVLNFSLVYLPNQPDRGVELLWDYADDMDLAGFQIYRGLDSTQTIPLQFVLMKNALIDKNPPLNSYSFTDYDISFTDNIAIRTVFVQPGSGGNPPKTITPTGTNLPKANYINQGVRVYYQVQAIFIDGAMSPLNTALNVHIAP